jgi:sphingomyelin phosphodiesterase 2
MGKKIKVLTLNCWGLPDFITQLWKSKPNKIKRINRMKNISKELILYDIVCLEEVWLEQDKEFFKKICFKQGFSYFHSFNSGIIGTSGLLVFSRFKISFFFKKNIIQLDFQL